MDNVDDWANSTLIKGDLAAAIKQLKAGECTGIAVAGSPGLVGSLVDQDLFDELVLLIHPVIAGEGRKKLFGTMADLDTSPTTGQTDGMSVKVGISLPDTTHARAVEHARSMGTTLSGFIDAALRAELTRRELADHVAMLAEADDADRLHARAGARSRALSAWKSGR